MNPTPSTVALCGAGMISVAHAYAARAVGLRVLSVASRTPERARDRAGQVGATAVDYRDLPAGADIVVVATPPAQHLEHAAYSLERGAAVLLEKPLVRTLDEADRLVDLAGRYGQRILYAENLAYAPVTRRFLDLISDEATAGRRIDHLEVRTIQSLPTWGGFTTAEWGGGALFDLGVHPIALAVLVARAGGAGEVVAVSGRLSGDTTDDDASVDLRFESGLVGRVVSSWRGGDTPVWDLQASTPESVVRAELMPSVVLEHNGEPVVLPGSGLDVPMIEQFGYAGQLRALVDNVTTGSTPFMDVSFGRWILEIVCAAYGSAAIDGDWIPVPSGCDRLATPLQLWRGR